MKSKKMILAGAFALACASLASAQTTIRVTGSSAFRSGTVTSIKALLNAGYDVAYNGTSDTGATYLTFIGTTNASGISGQSVIIQCTFTGAVDGIRDVSQGLSQPFIKASFVPNTNGTGIADTTQNVSTTTSDTSIFETAIPDITMEDSTQAASIYSTPALQETKVGVIPFVFVKGRVGASHPAKAAFDSVANMTSQLARSLFAGGVNISQFTGSVDASGTKLYVLGRNPLSGTRLVSFAEPGYGATKDATQFGPTVVGGVTTGTISTVDLYPAGSGFVAGNNGYSSGGNLADALSPTVADTDGSGNLYDGVPFGLIGYLGVSDAARVLKNINTTTATDVSYILSYNGVSLPVTYSTGTQAATWDYTPIKEGKYSFWSYEYLAYRKSSGANGTTALAGVAKTFADQLAINITANVPAASGVKLSDMKVERASEGAPITSL